MASDDTKLKLIAGLLLRQLAVHDANAPTWVKQLPPMAHWENAKRKDPKYLEGFMRDAAEILAELEKVDAE